LDLGNDVLRWIALLTSHGIALAVGFALGVYLLPILTTPPSVDRSVLAEIARSAQFETAFSRDLKGSDLLHWGEGKVSVGPSRIGHQGRLSPGPDYKLYLVPQFVDDEASFLLVKDLSFRVGDIKTFDGFMLDLPQGIDLTAYDTVLVWCEAFGEFITAAKYR
jgi:hypothetical protein